MNEDKTKPGESNRPSHEAAKVVIPFDIDISGIESKLAEIERRVSVITSSRQPQESQQDPSRHKTPDDVQELKQPESQQIGDAKSGSSYQEDQQILKQTQLIDIITRNQKEDEAQKTVMLASINRTNDLLRQINDTVLLMYSQMMTSRNNG